MRQATLRHFMEKTVRNRFALGSMRSQRAGSLTRASRLREEMKIEKPPVKIGEATFVIETNMRESIAITCREKEGKEDKLVWRKERKLFIAKSEHVARQAEFVVINIERFERTYAVLYREGYETRIDLVDLDAAEPNKTKLILAIHGFRI